MLAAKVRPRTRPADRQKEAVPGGSCIPYGAGPHSDFMPRSIVQRARGSLAPDRGRGTRSETWPLGAPAGQGPVFAELRRGLSRMRGTRRRSKGRTLGGDRRAQRANCLATVAAATNRFLLTLSEGVFKETLRRWREEPELYGEPGADNLGVWMTTQHRQARSHR